MEQIFIIVSTAIYTFLGLIWNRDDFLNALVKFLLFGAAFFGGYLIFTLRLFG